MSQIVSLAVTAQTRDALRLIVDDRRRPLAHILRARIVLLSDEHLPHHGGKGADAKQTDPHAFRRPPAKRDVG